MNRSQAARGGARLAWRWGGVTVLAVLAACSTTRPIRPQPPPPETPPPIIIENPTPPAPETSPADKSGQSAEAAGESVPPCLPPETKSKPRPKPKPKPVHKEAPPQLPTAPVVEATPAGGEVNAQVREMPVSVMSILGKPVKGPKGEDEGRVVDVLADASGRVRIAIIDFGGFLGVGDRRIAVDWPLLRFNPDGGDPSLLLSVGREKLKQMPEYKNTARPETLMEPETPPAAAPAAPAPAAATGADKKK